MSRARTRVRTRARTSLVVREGELPVRAARAERGGARLDPVRHEARVVVSRPG